MREKEEGGQEVRKGREGEINEKQTTHLPTFRLWILWEKLSMRRSPELETTRACLSLAKF